MESEQYIQSKLPQTRTTIFSEMSKLAEEHNAINLSQGFPSFSGSSQLSDLVYDAMRNGHNQYAPMQGVFSLRAILSEKIGKIYGMEYDPETEITITAGATQAIFTAISATISEGDEVILFTPAYDSYEPAIKLNKGKPVYVQLNAPDYKVDWNQVHNQVTSRTKMIIINTPHNPTGMVFDETDMLKLQKILNNTNIVVLSDEVYEHIVFGDSAHQSVSKYPGIAKHSFMISSFGKTYHNTGWKIGYCAAPKKLTEEFRKIHQYMVFSVNTPIQHALAEFLKKEEEYLMLSDFYEKKRDFFRNAVSGSKFKILPCEGTYFQLLSYKEICDVKDVDFAKWLTIDMKVASIPVSVFYNKPIDNKILRFCFAKEDDELSRAAEILHRL